MVDCDLPKFAHGVENMRNLTTALLFSRFLTSRKMGVVRDLDLVLCSILCENGIFK